MRLGDLEALEKFFLYESKRLRELLEDIDEEEKNYIKTILPTIEWARKTVHNTQTIDNKKYGKWELHGNDDDCGSSYFCSNCGKSYDEDWFYIHGEYTEWNFCPNCGTDMRGDIYVKDN